MICRHYHKAVWSEKRYQQLLSTSAPPTASTHKASRARRQLSLTLDSAAARRSTASVASIFTEGEATPTQIDPLQNSSDSVFMDNSHDRLLDNWEQPASPQIQPKGRGRPNPLTSHTAQLHTSSSLGEVPHRRVSVPSHTPITSWSVGVGPLSPLAKGHKSRTPSGRLTY